MNKEVPKLIRWIRLMEAVGLPVKKSVYNKALMLDSSFVAKPVRVKFKYRQTGCCGTVASLIVDDIRGKMFGGSGLTENSFGRWRKRFFGVKADGPATYKISDNHFDGIDDRGKKFIFGIDPVDESAPASKGCWYNKEERDFRLRWEAEVGGYLDKMDDDIVASIRRAAEGGPVNTGDGILHQIKASRFDDLPDSFSHTRKLGLEEIKVEFPDEYEKNRDFFDTYFKPAPW